MSRRPAIDSWRLRRDPRAMATEIIDAWAQHPTARHLNHPMFESLRRWTQGRARVLPRASCRCRHARRDGRGRRRPQPDQRVDGPARRPDLQRRSRRRSCARRPTGWSASARWTSRSRGPRCANCAAACANSASRPCACCRGCGSCRRRMRASIPVYSECCELGIPFCTQVGHTGPLLPSEFGRPIPYIDQVAIDFPDSSSSAATSAIRGPRR